MSAKKVKSISLTQVQPWKTTKALKMILGPKDGGLLDLAARRGPMPTCKTWTTCWMIQTVVQDAELEPEISYCHQQDPSA